MKEFRYLKIIIFPRSKITFILFSAQTHQQHTYIGLYLHWVEKINKLHAVLFYLQ